MKKRVLSLLAVLALTAALSAPALAVSELPFTDVPEDYWAYEMVLFSYQNSLIRGKRTPPFSRNLP